MSKRVTLSLAVAVAVLAAPMRLPAACVLSNLPSEKACQPACCANKTCCETSQKRTGVPAQPLTTSGSQQQNAMALTPVVSNANVDQTRATETPGFSIAEHLRHSPATLALTCIRLI